MFNKLFPANEGRIDRAMRIILGIVLLSLTLRGSAYAWGFIGVVPLLTGIIGSCPVYSLFGITTCPYNPARKTT